MIVVIDADAHVEESAVMFERLDKEFYGCRPLAVWPEGDLMPASRVISFI